MGSDVNLTPYLEELEARIDPAVEDDLRQQWLTFLEGRGTDPIFTPARQRKAPATLAWPSITVNQAMADQRAMALQQLRGLSDTLEAGSGQMLCVRCNYGVGILPTLFGARLFMMEDEQNCLPNVWPLDGGIAGIRRALEAGVPGFRQGLGEKVLTMGAFFNELIAPYPNLRRHLHIYHPDLQGPMDICELLWGSSIFTDMIDQPETVHAMLALIVETYTRFLREWLRIVPPLSGAHDAHWGLYHKGHIMLRDDSAMNLSPPMFREFIFPYDQQLITAFGGGCVHFCGRGSHYIAILSTMQGLNGINMSQPDYNDMEAIYTHTVDKGIPLLGFNRQFAQTALAAGRDLNHLVHCW